MDSVPTSVLTRSAGDSTKSMSFLQQAESAAAKTMTVNVFFNIDMFISVTFCAVIVDKGNEPAAHGEYYNII